MTDQPLRIGVTSADDPTPDNYVAAVERFGAQAVVLKSRSERVSEDLDGVAGLIISGGADIDPQLFGALIHDRTEIGDPARDTYEIAAARYAIAQSIPLLAICRGFQILNVAFEGTLHQHIPDVVAGIVRHRDMERKFETFDDHMVSLEPDSQLATILGVTRFATNASHHQAIDRVGTNLRVTGRTDDGIIEALECSMATNFCIAVQWHPERLLDADEGRSRKIFEAFLEKSRSRVVAFTR